MTQAAAAHNIPAGFVGKPRDMGRLAIFLASDERALYSSARR